MFGLDFKDWNTYFGLISIIGFVFSIWQYYKTKTVTKLTLYIQELSPILSDSLSGFKNLQIKIIENNFSVKKDVYHLRCFLKNNGNIDISDEKIYEALKFSLHPDAKILDYYIQSYPESVDQKTVFNKKQNEFNTTFKLLRKGELIQYDLIVHVSEETKKQHKLKKDFQTKSFISSNIVLNGRIENCKELNYSWFKKENPLRTYFTSFLFFIFTLLIASLPLLITIEPYRIVKNNFVTVDYKSWVFPGTIELISNDSLQIFDKVMRKTYTVSRADFNKYGSIKQYERKKNMPITIMIVFMSLVLIALFLLAVYPEILRARNKGSIINYIKNLQ